MDATHNDNRELHQVLDPSHFEEVIKGAEAQKARLLKAKEALEPGDMLEHWTEFLGDHLDKQIQGWRSDLAKAKERVAVAKS